MDRKLNIVKKRAYDKGFLNWDTIKISNRKNKRFCILSPSFKIVHFGLYPYKKGAFIDHHNEILRQNWRKRHSKILKNNKPAFMDPESPAFYSWHLLW